jgi:ATP synthase protein I
MLLASAVAFLSMQRTASARCELGSDGRMGSCQVHERFAHTVAWLLRWQAILSVLGAAVYGLIAGAAMGLAVLVGGGIGLLLTSVTGLRIGLSLGRDPKAMIAAFYKAMAFKLVLAVILFVIVAKWFAGFFLPVMIGYMATVLAYWLAMWRLAPTGPISENSEQ